ncbi:MAG: sulfite exporter TauE/SafE family protein [Bacteroidales bacterium]|nr:sulfite exporter TauE/SafE family protein [Bacteroidales bacterium]MCF8333581.1 sulfite exporter TauE/SafE family protein [Bacteroidales bacterium]
MTTIEIIALIITGFLVGFINTLAGGATIISLSMLMFLGLPLNVANGTHRIAAALQTFTSVATFRSKKVLDWRKGLVLGLPVIIGSVIGARIAIEIDEAVFEKIVAGVMIMMLLLIIYKPKRWLYGKQELLEQRFSWKQVIIFFILGLYGGFIYVGIGYFLLAAIVLSAGYDVVRANAIKVLIVLMYVPFTIGIFLWGDMINLQYGLVLAAGQVAGAYIGARSAVAQGAGFVRWVMVIFIFFSVAHLTNLINVGELLAVIG